MYNFWNRANGVFFTSLTALAILCACTTLSTYGHTPNPIVRKLALTNVERFNKNRLGQEQATLRFDLDADLRSVFNWNVKQLFVYVVAEYQTTKNVMNQVVIWDDIVQHRDHAKMKLKNEKNAYILIDQHDGLRNNNINLTLHWDIMPVCGRLFDHSRPGSAFAMPTVYLSDKNRRRQN